MSAARQFMNSQVESIVSGETVDVAAKRMRDADVGALLVTDEGGALHGVITETMGRSRVRRLPVTENGRLVGVIGVSDLVKAATPDEIGDLVGKIVHRASA